MSRYTLQELEFLSVKLSKNTTIVDKAYKGRPDEIFPILLKGNALGFDAVESIQSIMVVNGKMTMWGYALPALAFNSGEVEKLDEFFEGTYPEPEYKAVCIIKRRGLNENKVMFSLGDAKKAKLWYSDGEGKGQWGRYTKRMLQIRARGFCLRDTFADKLKGLIAAEEALDYNTSSTASPKFNKIKPKEEQSTPACVAHAISQDVNTSNSTKSKDVNTPQTLNLAKEFLKKIENFIRVLELSSGSKISKDQEDKILGMITTISEGDGCALTEMQLIDRATIAPEKFMKAFNEANSAIAPKDIVEIGEDDYDRGKDEVPDEYEEEGV